MTGRFRVVLHQGDETASIVDESFKAESVEQILRCKPDDVVYVEAVKIRDLSPAEAAKIRDLGPEGIRDHNVWDDLRSMRDNLAEAAELTARTPEAIAADEAAQLRALNCLTVRLN